MSGFPDSRHPRCPPCPAAKSARGRLPKGLRLDPRGRFQGPRERHSASWHVIEEAKRRARDNARSAAVECGTRGPRVAVAWGSGATPSKEAAFVWLGARREQPGWAVTDEASPPIALVARPSGFQALVASSALQVPCPATSP